MNEVNKMENKATTLNYQLSFWEQEVFFKKIDFTIIGAGIVGLNAALELKKKAPKANIVVLDRGGLPIGASTRNAGFACIGSMSELLADFLEMEEEKVWHLVKMRFDGLKKMRAKLGDQAIQYQELGGYEIFTSKDKEVYHQCCEKLASFNQKMKSITGLHQTYTINQTQNNAFGLENIEGLILNRAEGQLHPGRMMHSLIEICKKENITLLTGVPVKSIESQGNKVLIQTEMGWSFESQVTIIATNGFTPQILPKLEVKPARNQVLITHPITNLKIRGCFHYDRGYYYFRNVGNRILLGGGRLLSPEIETTSTFGLTDLIKDALVKFLEEIILPNQKVTIDKWWSGILGIGKEKSPIIKSIDQNIISAVRMGGMGVAIGTLVGEQAADVALGN